MSGKRVILDQFHDGLSPSEFERLIYALLDKMGFSELELTAKSGDGGIDLVGTWTQTQVPGLEIDLNYVLDGRAYTLPPGYYQDLGYGRQWVIEFHRGGPFGAAKYTVGNVKHVFVPTEKGWELVRQEPKS